MPTPEADVMTAEEAEMIPLEVRQANLRRIERERAGCTDELLTVPDTLPAGLVVIDPPPEGAAP
jgi:hypothetical protein